MARSKLVERYGEWALVAGASEGLGAAFARTLAARGMSLVLCARRADLLEATAAAIRDAHGVEVETRALDLAAPSLPDDLGDIARAHPIGLGVYNAAYSPKGELVSIPLEEAMRAVDVNVRGPLAFARVLAPDMIARGRGALVLMSSLAGLQGSPRLATYAATKAFDIVLAESLWAELAPHGVDVLTVCAGAIRTPGYLTARSGTDAPGTLDPEVVVDRTLRALGRGPRVVPGLVNQLASLLVGRWLPRRAAIAIMGSATRALRAGDG